MDYKRYRLSKKEAAIVILESIAISVLISKLFFDSFWGMTASPAILLIMWKKTIEQKLEERNKKVAMEFQTMLKNVSSSLLAGFSVGCFESLLYTVSGISSIGIRLFTAVILHSFCAGLSGIFIYSLKHKCLQVMPFIFAVLFHGIYAYFVSLDSSSFFSYFSFLVILISIVECRAGYTKVKYILLKREEPPVNPSAATVVEEKASSGKSKKLTSKSFSRSTVSGRKSKTSSSKIDSSKVGTFEKKSVSPKRK